MKLGALVIASEKLNVDSLKICLVGYEGQKRFFH